MIMPEYQMPAIPSLDEVRKSMYIPRHEFRERAEANLVESRVMERARKSKVYRLLWGDKEYKAELASLEATPVLAQDFYTGFREKDPEIPSGPVKEGIDGWLCSTGSRKRKFFPFSPHDILRLGASGSRYASIAGLEKGEVIINIGADPPHCSQIMSDWSAVAYGLGTIPVVRGTFANPEKLKADLMGKAGSIVGLTGVPLIGIMFLGKMKQMVPVPLDRAFPKLRMAVMAGESMNGKQRKAFGSFNVEGYEMYGSAELSAPAVECRYHTGMHMFLDENIYTIDVEQKDGTTKREYLFNCKKGDIGAVRATTPFRESFPLINYELKDVIEIIATECPCGITSPLVKVVSRKDDVLNFGGAKAYEQHIEQKFEEVGVNHVIPNWLMRWNRDNEGGYHRLDVHIDSGETEGVLDSLLDSLAKDPRTEQMWQAWEAGILNIGVRKVTHEYFEAEIADEMMRQKKDPNSTPKRLRIIKDW